MNSIVLERTAAVYTTVVITKQLFLSMNDTVELGWLEREYYATNKAKWDGILFKVCNHKVPTGFVEFSGGANDRTSIQKERHGIQKLYKMMADMLNGHPSGIKKQVFCFDIMIEHF
ncbi:hypothetical protein G6F43_012900 [Rhizopus delemar]|nr:hypothetical protein G6F43_012900 [Rhizopus delemar]